MKTKFMNIGGVALATVAAASTGAMAQDAGFAETLSSAISMDDILTGLAAIGALALTVTVAVLAFRKIKAMLAGA